jgi:hypothetical protein
MNVDALPPATLHATLARIVLPHRRKRLVQLAIVMATVDGEVSRESARAVAQLARALLVVEPGVGVLAKLARRHTLATRFALVRRIFGRFLADAWRVSGHRGVGALIAGLLGRGEDELLAARYRKLSLYPAGSLGRSLWEHCASRSFALPGMPGAIPERILFHDIGHVLSGYDTDPAGEIQQAAFQAGFLRNDGFAFLFFGIIQFHLGIKLTPIAAAEVGYFDIDKVMTALARGAACRADLSQWAFWSNAARPLEQVRAELGIPALRRAVYAGGSEHARDVA